MTLTNPRRAVAAACRYVGSNVAALCAAVEFGIQPDLFRRRMAHLSTRHFIFAHFRRWHSPTSRLPALLNRPDVGVIAYLQRANVPVLRINHPNVQSTA